MFIRNSMQSHRVIVIVPFLSGDRRAAHIRHLLCFLQLNISIAMLFSTSHNHIRIRIHFDVFCFSTFNGFSIPCSLFCCLRCNITKWVEHELVTGERAIRFIKRHAHMSAGKTFIRRMTQEFKMKWEKCTWSCRCWRKENIESYFMRTPVCMCAHCSVISWSCGFSRNSIAALMPLWLCRRKKLIKLHRTVDSI